MTPGLASGHAKILLNAVPAASLLAEAEWRGQPDANTGRCRAGPAVTTDCLAALDTAEPGSLRAADVIICEGSSPAPAGWVWPQRTLQAHPGCTVVAVSLGASQCLVAARPGGLAQFTVLAKAASPACRALVCATFVYGWLCARQPLAALGPAVRITAGSPAAGLDALVQGRCLRCSVHLACSSPPGHSRASRALTSLASGTPSSL